MKPSHLLSPKTRYHVTRKNGKNIGMHRDVMEKHLGHKLRPDEHVHHINEIKTDNRIENLEVKSARDHAIHHLQKYPIDKICEVCGGQFTPHKTKRKRQKTCSVDCSRISMSRNGSKRKLSEDQTREIIRRRTFGEKLALLAAEFGVSQTTICELAKGHRPHLPK